MYAIDPENPNPAAAPEGDAAAAAIAGAEAAAPVAETPVDPVDGMLEAVKEADVGGQAAADTEAAAGTEVATPAEAKPGDAAKASDAAAKPEDGKPEPDKAIEDEIATLNLKDKSADRFRGMAVEIREFAPVRDALVAAGVKTPDDVKRIVKDATDGNYLITEVTKTGATGADFTRMLDVMSSIAAGRKGDRAAVERSFQMIGEEYAAIARALGKEIPGVFDPLAEHKDLQDLVGAGDMPKEKALEVAQARRTLAAQQHQQHEQSTQTQQQEAQQQALAQGVEGLKTWEQAKAADPAYAALRPALNAEVGKIREQYPPSQWVAMTEYAYRAIAAQAAATPPPAAPRPTPGPVRPSGPRPSMAPTTDDPVEAMMQGIAEATP